MAAGKELRYRILRYLSERQGGRTDLGDITRDLSLTALEVSDQLDILHDLGAIKANRTIDGGAVPTLKGAGKLLLEELEQEFGRAPSSGRVTAEAKSATGYEWDAFIAHASEDKEPFVRQLATALRQEFRIWYDDFTLTVGDGLRRSIDRGLKKSRFGIVVLSKHFFQKEWPQKELDGLTTKERDGTKVILPVWLDVEYEDVANYSPLLADRVAAKAKDGLDRVVADLRKAMEAGGSTPNRQSPPEGMTTPDRNGSGSGDTAIETTQPATGAAPPHPASIPVAVATAKRYLSDPRHQISLHDLVHQETEEIYREVAGTTAVPGSVVTPEGFVQLMRRYDALAERLASIMSVVAYHDSGENSHLLARTITRLANFPRGQGVLEVLQHYPALILTYAAGVSALAAARHRNLFAVLCEPTYRDPYDSQRTPALSLMNVWSVFRSPTDKWIPRPSERESTPANNHLLELLIPIVSEYIPDQEEYVDTFDLFEYLLALTYSDIVRKDWIPPGRYWWHWKYRRTLPSTSFLAQGLEQGDEWSLLKAGFFRGSAEHLRQVVHNHDEYVKKANQW